MNEVCDRIVPSVWRFLGNATHPSMEKRARLVVKNPRIMSTNCPTAGPSPTLLPSTRGMNRAVAKETT